MGGGQISFLSHETCCGTIGRPWDCSTFEPWYPAEREDRCYYQWG